MTACHTCLQVNPRHTIPREPLRPLPPVDRPFQRVHIDLLQLPVAPDGHKYALVMVDAFSRFVEVHPLPTKDAPTVAEAVVTAWICRHGAPESFHSDLGTEFTNEIFKRICSTLHISNVYTSPGHPAGNGRVERVNRTILQYLRKFIAAKNDWPRLLPYAVFSCNTTVHSATGFSPYFLLHLHDPRLPLSLVDEASSPEPADAVLARMRRAYTMVSANNDQAFARAKKTHDARIHPNSLKLHDKVYLRATGGTAHGKKLNVPYVGPYFVVSFPTPAHVDIRRNRSAKLLRVHRDRLKLLPYTRLALDHTLHSPTACHNNVDSPITQQSLPPPTPPLLPSPPAPSPAPSPPPPTPPVQRPASPLPTPTPPPAVAKAPTPLPHLSLPSQQPPPRTRVGRVSRAPTWLGDYVS